MFDNKDQFSAGPNGQYPQENSNVQPNIYVVGPQNPMGSEIGKNYRDNLYAQCAVGNHRWETVYGIGGIIAAIVCFPCGLVGLCLDSKIQCEVCQIIKK